MADLETAPRAATTRLPSSRSGWGSALIAAVIVLGLGTRQSQVVPLSLGLTPATVIIYGCLLLLLLCWLGGQAISSPHRPTMLLVMVAFMATVCSTAALMLRNASNAEASASVLVLVRESWLVGLVLFILVVVRSSGGLRLVMRGIVIGASISGAVGLLNTLIGLDVSSALALPGLVDQGSLLVDSLQRAGAVRPQGMAGHPLELSAVLTVAFPLAVGLAMSDRDRGRSGVLWGLMSGLVLVSALATISRSAVIGAAAALAVMAWSWPVRRVIVLVASGAVGLLLALVTGVPIVTRVASVLSGGSQDNSVGSRRSGFSYATGVMPDHWWFGQGSGTYDPRVQPVLDNYYLTRAVESGLIGAATIVVMLVGAWLIASSARRRLADAGELATAELVNGIVGAITAFIVIGLILDVPGFIQISMLQYVVIALAGVAAMVSHQASAA